MTEEYELFFELSKREQKKERKLAAKKDRSKEKITDLKKQKKTSYPVSSTSLRGRVLSLLGDKVEVKSGGKIYHCSVRGALKKERSKSRTLIAVGDYVEFEKEKEKDGKILSIEERLSVLAREDPFKKKQHIIATNIDQVLITSSIAEPNFKPFLIDRYIISAKQGNMDPIIVINKMDLLASNSKEARLFEEFEEIYTALGYTIIPVSCETKEGIPQLKKVMKGRTSAFSGQSGVGKSSLINLTLGLDLPTGEVQRANQKGKHTTTKAQLIPMDKESFCIDTPGIRHFGLWQLSLEDIQKHFPEIEKVGKDCKYSNCLHKEEPGCAVKEAVEDELIFSSRYTSYLTLMEER